MRPNYATRRLHRGPVGHPADPESLAAMGGAGTPPAPCNQVSDAHRHRVRSLLRVKLPVGMGSSSTPVFPGWSHVNSLKTAPAASEVDNSPLSGRECKPIPGGLGDFQEEDHALAKTNFLSFHLSRWNLSPPPQPGHGPHHGGGCDRI